MQHFWEKTILDPECFTLKTDNIQTTNWPFMNTMAEMASLQQDKSTQTTRAGLLLHDSTTTNATQIQEFRPTDTPSVKFPTFSFTQGLQYVENFFYVTFILICSKYLYFIQCNIDGLYKINTVMYLYVFSQICV